MQLTEHCYVPDHSFEVHGTSSTQHTMGSSLAQYLDLKLHPLFLDAIPDSVAIVPRYDRTEGVSCREKNGKLFNFKRPTAVRDQHGRVTLRCFPGFDYVAHFGKIVASHFLNIGHAVPVRCSMPSAGACASALKGSGLIEVPEARTVILGYVEGLDRHSPDTQWRGCGDFMWKRFSSRSEDAILVGCAHTYWGDIAGTLVDVLVERGTRLVIYAGKLGSLSPTDAPNEVLATASESVLPNGERALWSNVFDDVRIDTDMCRCGLHVTVPSVLQETIAWRDCLDPAVRFVDPEIGHMAAAANRAGIGFSILHIVSDNLARSFEHNLSNERDPRVRERRKLLADRMTEAIQIVVQRSK